MLLPVLFAVQMMAAQPVCAALDSLIRIDLRVGGECRVDGVRLEDVSAEELPFRSLHVDGIDARALSKLRSGLDHFVRVSTPLAEANLRGSIEQALDDFADAVRFEPRLTEAAVAAAQLALLTRLEGDMRRARSILDAGQGPGRSGYSAELALALGETAAIDTAPVAGD
ncbi:MAG TPA: hypothetical protein VF215_00275, partial [Thermoanaerobaculia bacterium]